ECISYLIELLNDAEPVVRNTAIKTASKKFNNEIIAALIENLGNPAYSNQAMNTLVLIGSKTLPALEAAFYRSGQSTQIILRIIQVMGRIGGQRAKDLLWNKIDFPNKVVISQVLLALGECGFKAGITQITRIKYAIESDIADIRWNLSAIQELEETGISNEIVNALKWEIQNDIEHIYMLLAMLYDTRSIQLVKENIDSGTTEGITYAVELLDIFLSDQLKQRVIPILDEINESERIARLDVFFPRIKLDSRLVLKFIINRDFSQSNRWTKACVLFQVGLLRQSEFKLDLIAQLFNPDLLIREVSAWALYQLSPEEYQENTTRLGISSKKELDAIVIQSLRISRFEKVLFFHKFEIFEDVPGITLTYLADFSQELDLKLGEQLFLDDAFDFYLVLAGSVEYHQKGEQKAIFNTGQFIGEMLGAPNFINTNRIIAVEATKLIRFNKEQFYELLTDNVRLTGNVVEFI
ncbi:MAG: cyclic nucleotide-binding domain-containing protein, partial [Flammeovirgaceae bacterium]|nr:cyclic nucleotide-binding domain-containing protein [Flammeovirgaceae bacterium]